MNRIILTLIVIFISIQITAQDVEMKKLQTIIDEIKSEYIPDKRVALFDVSIKKSESALKLVGLTTEPYIKMELIKRIESAKIDIQDSIVTLPSEKRKGKVFGIINNSVANLRGNPRHSAELVTQAILGTPVKVFKKKDGFYLIQTPDKYISWVDSDGIKTIEKEQYRAWYNSDKIIYTNEYGFSYSETNENSERISDLVIGNILEKLSEEGEFAKVKYPDGREAFVLKSESQNYNEWLKNALPTKENIIETAKIFMGNPYLWGGTSAKGMDCSGFTKTVFFLNGVMLDRDASQQVKDGILVDTENGFENLEKGDLLFFGKKVKDGKRERITHVGIYIDNLEFIHEAGRVRYNSFDKNADNFSKSRLKGFIRAKRIITSIGENGIELIENNEFYNGELK
ncbi:MAG: C40 family peptidase [Melioribacteraceae bacterium]|nr:C40 family peptidase [Melioribacteraceae bacterium]